MKSWVLLLVILTFLGCASRPQEIETPSGLEIIEIKPNKWTAVMKQNMFHLAQVYDLSPFLFTRKIHVESKVIPHSHPVLTLNTRNAEKPHKILSVWLHEELHWWTEKNKKNTELAIKELKKVYPRAPITRSEGKDSTHLHLIVCYLEYRALGFYLGQKTASEVVTETMKRDKIYPWVYYQVLFRDYSINKIVKKYKLLPPPLT